MQLEALDKASIRKNDIPFHVMGTDDPRNCPISKNNGVAEIPEQLNSITHQINYSAIDDSDESDNSCDEVFEDNFDAQDWFYSDEIEVYSSDDDTNEIDTETVRVVINEESFLSSSFLSSKLQLILSYWAIDHNISHSAITDLLHSIKGDLPDLTELPYDARTLLKTPKFTGDIDIMENGQYCHFGMKTCLEKIVLNSKNHNESDEEIKLIVNIDGAPIGQSSEKSLWPILCSNYNSQQVYIIGVFAGESKPHDPNIFLKKFVDDSINFVNNGIEVNEKQYSVRIHALICDAPAKAFILNTKYHSGYDSCSKCTIEGTMFKCVCFPLENNYIHGEIPRLRYDHEFENDAYVGTYQRASSILNNIPKLGLVSGVPLDCLHLLYLGATRKLLLSWMFAKTQYKLPQIKIDIISSNLLILKNCILYEFAREPRKLKYIKLFKGTEFRQFLLYTGIIVLKNVVSNNVYFNFVTLHVAVTILNSPNLCKLSEWLKYASELLQKFVFDYQQLYGKRFVTHNTHNLLHLVEDCRKYGLLENFSAFSFENHLRQIKKMLRKGDRPLSQLVRRTAEIDFLKVNGDVPNFDGKVIFTKEHAIGPIIRGVTVIHQFSMAKFKNFKLNCGDDKNNCVQLRNGSIVLVKNFVTLNDDKKSFIGIELKTIGNVYEYPCTSNLLGTFEVKDENNQLKFWSIDDIVCKMCKFDFEKKNYSCTNVAHDSH
ncbi:hypothetical protein TKK_0006099 [Trichogramma kaykai]|uniref:Transposase domain-containing protein n=1 Tax=Trichogramma kaykai TaxID=54128 RepID=A0ABD2XFF0_9HYME